MLIAAAVACGGDNLPCFDFVAGAFEYRLIVAINSHVLPAMVNDQEVAKATHPIGKKHLARRRRPDFGAFGRFDEQTLPAGAVGAACAETGK